MSETGVPRTLTRPSFQRVDYEHLFIDGLLVEFLLCVFHDEARRIALISAQVKEFSSVQWHFYLKARTKARDDI